MFKHSLLKELVNFCSNPVFEKKSNFNGKVKNNVPFEINGDTQSVPRVLCDQTVNSIESIIWNASMIHFKKIPPLNFIDFDWQKSEIIINSNSVYLLLTIREWTKRIYIHLPEIYFNKTLRST